MSQQMYDWHIFSHTLVCCLFTQFVVPFAIRKLFPPFLGSHLSIALLISVFWSPTLNALCVLICWCSLPAASSSHFRVTYYVEASEPYSQGFLFVQKKIQGSSFSLHFSIQISQHHWLKMLSFLQSTISFLVKIKWLQLCAVFHSTPRMCICFCFNSMLSLLWSCHAVWSQAGLYLLQYSLCLRLLWLTLVFCASVQKLRFFISVKDGLKIPSLKIGNVLLLIWWAFPQY